MTTDPAEPDPEMRNAHALPSDIVLALRRNPLTGMDQLDEWAYRLPGWRIQPFEKLPEMARMIRCVNEMLGALGSSGICYVLDWDIGDHYHDLEAWLAEIGAVQATVYLHEATAFFPRGRVPDDKDERSDYVERWHAEFARLDKRYRLAALDEIPARFATFLLCNQAQVETDLAMLAGRTTSQP